MINRVKISIFIICLICISSGCEHNEEIIVPMVELYEDYVDCNDDYIVEIKEIDNELVCDVIQENKVISRLWCEESDIDPDMIAVGRKGYYLLDNSSRNTQIFVVDFESKVKTKKKTPSYVNSIFCKNGYVFLTQNIKTYFDGTDVEYFFPKRSLLKIYKYLQRKMRVL